MSFIFYKVARFQKKRADCFEGKLCAFLETVCNQRKPRHCHFFVVLQIIFSDVALVRGVHELSGLIQTSLVCKITISKCFIDSIPQVMDSCNYQNMVQEDFSLSASCTELEWLRVF